MSYSSGVTGAQGRADGSGNAPSTGLSVEDTGTDEAHVASKSVTPGNTDLQKTKLQGKDEQSGDNTKKLKEDDDPLDKGATKVPDDGGWVAEDDNGESTGPTPEMDFPLLDVEPNSVTSLNGGTFEVNLTKRQKKPKIDYEQLAYESVVGNMQGYKKAYNSSSYGKLDPQVDIAFHPKAFKKQVYKIDPESIQDSAAEASFGFRKANQQLADDFKRSMRTYVQPNSHYHGGPTMFKRGLNQFRNQAIRKEITDPNPETVEVAVQNARDAFVLNNQVLYANNNTKLQFKTTYNAARVIPDSTNTGHIPNLTNWFDTQAGVVGGERTWGYTAQGTIPATRDESGTFAGNLSQTPRVSYSTQGLPSHAPAQKNTDTYATHPTSSTTQRGGTPATTAPTAGGASY